jgi:hypothetical protein
MKVKEGFIEGFLVLGFAIFILGLLVGMLALALINVKIDQAILFITFSTGMITGILIISLILVTYKVRSSEKS